jgi:ribonuclease HI
VPTTPTQILVHADESCLGNGREPPNRGGNAALVEVPAGDSVARWDVFECSPDTTNQRMALAGAIVALEWVHRQWQGADIRYVSDSEYLIKGMSAWVSDWEARGWRRKGGPIENLELWRKLVQAARSHQITWRWVRGHAGHPKNEYANFLALHAAERQERSNGLIPSGFDAWLARERTRGTYDGYDPDGEVNERP